MRFLLPLSVATLIGAAPVLATDDCTQDGMVVFDGSGSMAEMGFNQIDEPRIFEARRAVADAMPEVAAVRRLGLIVYGPNGGDSCAGVDLRFAPTHDAAPAIIGAVDALEPDGDTALTQAVAMAAEVLDHRSRPGVIVLVTDGKETCGGAPCALAAELAADNADLTVHVIGFKVRGRFFSWQSEGASDYNQAESVARCLSDRTGGHYVSAETVDELTEALRKTLGCALLY